MPFLMMRPQNTLEVCSWDSLTQAGPTVRAYLTVCGQEVEEQAPTGDGTVLYAPRNSDRNHTMLCGFYYY